MMREGVNIEELVRDGQVKIVAPMVRYSKLPFRLLCKKWGADICFTPMIIAEAFNRSEAARDSDFQTCKEDIPLVVQFGTKDPMEFASAAVKVEPYCDAIDLNCGCPQRWAMQEGIGASLSSKPKMIYDIVSAAKKRVSKPISIKIRLHQNMKVTMELIKAAELAGVSWITVHGRTASERSRVPVHLDSIRFVKESANVPVIANGDVFTPQDVCSIIESTGVNGVMSARGILANPALFKGYDHVPLECVQDYLDLALQYGGRFAIHHHHFMFMVHRHLNRPERVEFSKLNSMAAVIDFFRERLWIE
jgi:tRNA-dihydrouridine synthase 4